MDTKRIAAKLQRVLDWLRHEAKAPGRIGVEIEWVLAPATSEHCTLPDGHNGPCVYSADVTVTLGASKPAQKPFPSGAGWRCEFCGEMADDLPGTDWRWMGDRWQHSHGQEGHFDARFFGRAAQERCHGDGHVWIPTTDRDGVPLHVRRPCAGTGCHPADPAPAPTGFADSPERDPAENYAPARGESEPCPHCNGYPWVTMDDGSRARHCSMCRPTDTVGILREWAATGGITESPPVVLKRAASELDDLRARLAIAADHGITFCDGELTLDMKRIHDLSDAAEGWRGKLAEAERERDEARESRHLWEQSAIKTGQRLAALEAAVRRVLTRAVVQRPTVAGFDRECLMCETLMDRGRKERHTPKCCIPALRAALDEKEAK